MKFEISKATAGGSDNIYSRPCAAAVFIPKVDDPNELGTWVVDVDSPEGIVALQKEVGHDLIIQKAWDAAYPARLLVYDDYLELT